VVSDKAAGAGYSGVGTTGLFAVGTDVAGTIGGETAQGKGRTLTGNLAGGAANGLAVQVTAGAPGGFGKVTVQRGAAATVVGVVSRLTDLFSGTIQQEQNTLDARLASSQQAVTDITARVDAYIDNMQRQFTRMETQISRFKSQSAQLAQTIAGLNKSNKDG
jgi:flagellar hook-associated protein 2